MAVSLESIKRSTRLPPRIVIYGVPGVGKTTFASQSPSPVFIPAEDGFGTLQVDTFPRPKSFADITDAITTLIEEDHGYKTVVLDSADKIEPLIHEAVCEFVPHEKGHKCERIEQYGYGKGYAHALTEWRLLTRGLDVLREARGVSPIIIAHSTVAKVESPETDTYDRYQMALHKSADAWLCDWADAVLFANFDIVTVSKEGSERKRAVGKGHRLLFCEERPAFRAKNRYGLPAKCELDWATVAPFLYPEAAK